MPEELTGKKAADPDTPPEKPFSQSVIAFAYTGVIAALIMSLTLNIYHDANADAAGKASYHPLPMFIAVLVGFIIPLLCGVLSHLAAEVESGLTGKLITYGIVGALMFVSAKAGTAALTPVMGQWTALIAAIGADSVAMRCIHILMNHQERKKALKKWEREAADRARKAEETARRRQAEEAGRLRQAEAAALAARSSGSRRAVTPRDNTSPAAAGNTADNARDNARAAMPGNASQGTPRNAPGSAGERRESPGNVTPITRGQAPVPAAKPGKAPAKTDEELRLLIGNFYARCVEAGEQFGTRAFIREHGGSPNRVGPLIEKFLETRQDVPQGAREESAG